MGSRYRASALLAILFALGCVPGFGPFQLPETRGRVVDRDSGEPIAGAEVVEWHLGAGVGDGTRPVHHARWATADASGRFVLRSATSSASSWAQKTYAPVYAFYHADYGLQRGARDVEGERVLQGSRARKDQATLDLRPYCNGERDDPGSRRIAELACDD